MKMKLMLGKSSYINAKPNITLKQKIPKNVFKDS